MRIPIIDKLFNKSNNETHQAKPKAGAPRSVHHNPKDIALSLQKYADADTLIEGEARVKTDPLHFSTGILEVDSQKRLLIMDTLDPSEANSELKPGTQVHFALPHLGVRTQFDCVLKQSQASPNFLHTFESPKGIEHIQLRDAFRLKISSVNPVKITVENPDIGSYAGLVSDLSVTGARIQLKHLIQPKPNRGDNYPICYLTLSDGQRLTFGAQLMHWQYDPKKDVTVIGVKFLEMEPSSERKLNRFLTDLQRKERTAGM